MTQSSLLSLEGLYAAIGRPVYVAFPVGWRTNESILLSKDGERYVVCSVVSELTQEGYFSFRAPSEENCLSGAILDSVLVLNDVPFVVVPPGAPGFWPRAEHIVNKRRAIGLFIEPKTSKMFYVSESSLFPRHQVRVFVGNRSDTKLVAMPTNIDVRGENEILIDLGSNTLIRLTRVSEPYGIPRWQLSTASDWKTLLVSVPVHFLREHPYGWEDEQSATVSVRMSGRLLDSY